MLPRRLEAADLSDAAFWRATELLQPIMTEDPSLPFEAAWATAVRQAYEEDLAGVLPPSQEDWRRLAWLAKAVYPGRLSDRRLLEPEI